MYLKASVISLFLLGSTILFTTMPFGHKKVTIDQPVNAGIAVVELFTSQGCSSCPRADKLLSELIDEAEVQGLPLYGLSFHVDYWNRLGWKDPYSNKAFTDRQYAYARQMGKRGVYTPQMVVNGTHEFVGSDRSLGTKTIASAHAKQSPGSIIVDKLSLNQGQIHFTYRLTGVKNQSLINIALVEKSVSTQVTRGENRGRKLHHDNVVRVFIQHEESTKDEVSLRLPNDIDLKESSIIVYSQNSETLSIQSATRVSTKALRL